MQHRLPLIVGLAAILASFATQALAADKVSLRYAFLATGIDAPWVLGREKGFFAAEGIDLELREGKGSAVAAQTVAAGTDDFATDVDGATFIGLAAKGLPATAILANTVMGPLCILSADKAGFKTPKDLIGKDVGITLGSAGGVLLPVLLEKNGAPKDQVHIINLQPAALLTTLLTERADAIATFSTVGPALEQKGLKTHAIGLPPRGDPVSMLVDGAV